jgi:alkyldihydroxyacetonephosphate synthase
MKSVFHLTDDDFKTKSDEGNEGIPHDLPMSLSQEQIDFFTQLLGQDRAHADGFSRVKASYGKTMWDCIRLRKHKIENIPDLVLWPENSEEIQKIVAYCDQEKIPVYCRAGGSSVTRGTEAVKGGISLDLAQHFNKVIEFNEINHTVTVQSGMQGPQLEDALRHAPALFGAKHAFTCGHFPQSFEYSGVGGWVVTRGAGQNSSYYGKIEDMVIAQEYVTPRGILRTKEYPAKATGPDLDQIMIGSEGAFGILTHVTLKVFHWKPENHLRFSYIFPSWEAAQAAARQITQGEFGMPSVFRLSDPEETDVMLKLYGIEDTFLDKLMSLRGYQPMERCLFLGFTDGEKSFCKNIKRQVHRICKNHGGLYLTGIPVKSWEKGRFRDPYMRDALQDYGILIDTMEASVTWASMPKVHKEVREFVKSRPDTICMTHMSIRRVPISTGFLSARWTKASILTCKRGFLTGLFHRALPSAIIMGLASRSDPG